MIAKQRLDRLTLTELFSEPMFNLLAELGGSIAMTIARGNTAPQFKYKRKIQSYLKLVLERFWLN